MIAVRQPKARDFTLTLDLALDGMRPFSLVSKKERVSLRAQYMRGMSASQKLPMFSRSTALSSPAISTLSSSGTWPPSETSLSSSLGRPRKEVSCEGSESSPPPSSSSSPAALSALSEESGSCCTGDCAVGDLSAGTSIICTRPPSRGVASAALGSKSSRLSSSSLKSRLLMRLPTDRLGGWREPPWFPNMQDLETPVGDTRHSFSMGGEVL